MRKSARRKRKKETFGKWRMAARHAQGPEELAKRRRVANKFGRTEKRQAA